MAQTVFEKIVSDNGQTDEYLIDSAGLGGWHIGEKADSRMRSHAEKHGYTITHRARQIQKSDFERFDYIIGMDSQNIEGLHNLASIEAQRENIKRMTDFLLLHSSESIPDPYYGGSEDFDHVIDLLEDACNGFYKTISSA